MRALRCVFASDAAYKAGSTNNGFLADHHSRDLYELMHVSRIHQWLSRGTGAPLLPGRKSKSAPRSACIT